MPSAFTRVAPSPGMGCPPDRSSVLLAFYARSMYLQAWLDSITLMMSCPYRSLHSAGAAAFSGKGAASHGQVQPRDFTAVARHHVPGQQPACHGQPAASSRAVSAAVQPHAHRPGGSRDSPVRPSHRRTRRDQGKPEQHIEGCARYAFLQQMYNLSVAV